MYQNKLKALDMKITAVQNYYVSVTFHDDYRKLISLLPKRKAHQTLRIPTKAQSLGETIGVSPLKGSIAMGLLDILRQYSQQRQRHNPRQRLRAPKLDSRGAPARAQSTVAYKVVEIPSKGNILRRARGMSPERIRIR